MKKEKILVMPSKQFFGHQGDVAIERISKLPKTAKKCSVKPLAYGETTGHEHRVIVADPQKLEFYEDENGIYFNVVEGTEIRHKVGNNWTGEHHGIAVEPNPVMPYVHIRIQKVEDPYSETIDNVRD